MTEITHAKALRAIAAARRIHAAGPWRNNVPYLEDDAQAILLRAGTFGALLDAFASEVSLFSSAGNAAIAALIETLELVAPGWDKEAEHAKD